MREAMEASGASQGEMAEALLVAMASAKMSPEEIAQTMMEALNSSDLSPEEIQERVVAAMVESGASPEEIAKVIMAQKILQVPKIFFTCCKMQDTQKDNRGEHDGCLHTCCRAFSALVF